MKHWKPKIHIIAQELFQYSLVVYLILLIVEMLKEGFVSYYFNPNIVLGIVLVSGFIMVITHTYVAEPSETKKVTGSDMTNSIFFAIGGALLVHYKTQELGSISLVITGISFLIIVLLFYLILSDSPEKTQP